MMNPNPILSDEVLSLALGNQFLAGQTLGVSSIEELAERLARLDPSAAAQLDEYQSAQLPGWHLTQCLSNN